MRMLASLLLIAVQPVAITAARAAPAPVANPDIVVTGDNRIVCRYVSRTGTRMRVGRVCRRLSDWRTDSDAAIRAGLDANGTIEGAADTLDVLGQRSTVRSDTSLGPR
jgi:hypothetical protein